MTAKEALENILTYVYENRERRERELQENEE